jgi:nucleoside-diphosphate-sugar epimerase
MNNAYIVTGATGFLGEQVAKKILDDSNVVILLGKGKNNQSFEERVSSLFPTYDKKNIYTIEADLETVSEKYLIEEVGKLNFKIQGIWHLAANLSFKEEDRDKVFMANINGLLKIIHLSQSLQSKLFYTSTAYVHGRQSGVANEDFNIRPKYFNNPYEESKYEAEQIIKNSKNLDFSIFRPSILYDTNAEYVTNFGYYSFLIALFKFKSKFLKLPRDAKILVPLPFFYRRNSFLNLMPTNIAIDWMFKISNSKQSSGKIFHICNPNPFLIKDIFKQTFKAFNISIPLIGAPSAIAFIYFKLLDFFAFFIKPIRPIAQRIYYFKWYLLKHMDYDMTNTQQILGYNIKKDFNFSNDHIYKLASSIIIKLENYKKK